MNNSQLIDALSHKTLDVSTKKGLKEAVEAVFTTIEETLKSGEDVAINGFGKFKIKDRPARQGRNPATGASVEIAASRKVSFTPSKTMKDGMN
jgi:DNA-binding protein HU-beta